ncbi:MAG: response regulator, partial [Bryobacterales bacterium]|nr:response regulator [Bryobacterales bacterium]
DPDGLVVRANRGAAVYASFLVDEEMLATTRVSGSASRETTLRRASGEIADVHFSLHAVSVGFVLFVRDLAGEKQLERQLRLNNAKLIAETQRAEHASQAKSHFIATVSHEIRTPLNAILGMADMLEDSTLDSNQRHYVSVFQRAGYRLLNLINNLLDIARIESGRFELEQVEFRLDEVVQRSLELVAPKAHDKGLAIQVCIAPDVVLSRIGDPARLQQILLNLLSNSVKFTEKGSVTIGIDAGEGPAVSITVADTGVGIPQEKMGVIFHDFTQVDTSTARRYGGTGLGLGIVRRLVELMGGRIGVESAPDEGTTFRLTMNLRLGRGEPIPAPARVAPAQQVLQNEPKRRILVAEDSLDNQILMRAYFERTPYSVEFVSDGRAAVNMFVSSGQFDLILMDVQMPGMDGWSAVRAIRAIEREQGRPPIPIIALSARAQAADEALSREAGCQQHLTKPISRQALFEAIRKCCQAVELPPAIRALGPAYLNKRRQEVPLILELLAQADYERIATLAHNLKGTGAAYGFPQISVIGAEMEAAAKLGDEDAVRRQVLRLEQQIA